MEAEAERRRPVTRQVLWGLPVVLGVAGAVAAVAEVVTGDQAGWYVVWPVVAVLVAAVRALRAGPYRWMALALAPGLAVYGTGATEGPWRWWLAPVVVGGWLVAFRLADGFRWSDVTAPGWLSRREPRGPVAGPEPTTPQVDATPPTPR